MLAEELREAVVEREVVLLGGRTIEAVTVVVGETEEELSATDVVDAVTVDVEELPSAAEEVVGGVLDLVVGEATEVDVGGATGEVLEEVSQVVIVTVVSMQFLKKSARRAIRGGRDKSHQRCSICSRKCFNAKETYADSWGARNNSEGGGQGGRFGGGLLSNNHGERAQSCNDN
jgi:hypothetical protein